VRKENQLPKGIGLNDIDGEIERNRWFLRLEKKSPGETIPVGQRILLEHLSDIPEFTVIVFFGSEWNPEVIERWNGSKHTPIPSLLDAVGSWWQWANKYPQRRYR
jgi:hypothetical protein